ncbi:14738_t:CDS:2 [Entrophospora sp. SA101]|nr:998_t:CDS:2 [Entrophospora sp. SA101]CAJ0633092.1 12597_t:CDS:2 [Entrophospora sp. SA101]CAJ0746650.1 1202_t:CDS:2 [Entrophospora sp. SA101]CAJ0754469.1 14738_t:CDS:2 [Entrophospora sp. SA101]CAJ0902446.1 14649_t:CDS:2 [Entrophospora sp. SA101]
MYINLGLFIALGCGSALSYYETSTSSIESPFDDYKALFVVGSAITTLTIIPGMITKFLSDHFGLSDYDPPTRNKISFWSIYPIIWTLSWSLLRRYSPVGSWGDWSYTLDSSGYSGNPIMQLASIGGLSAINLLLSTWSVVASNHIIYKYKIKDRKKRLIYQQSRDNENTPLLISSSRNTPSILAISSGNNRITRPTDPALTNLEQNLKFNYNAALGLFVFLFGVIFFYNFRLSHFENTEPVELIRVGCMLPGAGITRDEMLTATADLGTSKAVKIILWSESALPLHSQEEYSELLENVMNKSSTYKFWLGFTYTIPTGYSNKKRNMLTFIGPDHKDILFEYQKTHPVWLAESWSTEGGEGKLPIVDVEYEDKNKKHHRNYTTDLRISGAICLDMDFPELLNQASSANLVLSPAQTFSTYVGLQHLRMSSIRAIENGYWILRCDQGGASGLIDPLGRIRNYEISIRKNIQLITWDVPFDSIKKVDTYYGALGETLVWVFIGFLISSRAYWVFGKESHVEFVRNFVDNFYSDKVQYIDDRIENIILNNF